MNPELHEDYCLFAMAAFRYALGRQTHIVESVANVLVEWAENMPEDIRELIVREIDEAGVLSDVDKPNWLRVRAAMTT